MYAVIANIQTKCYTSISIPLCNPWDLKIFQFSFTSKKTNKICANALTTHKSKRISILFFFILFFFMFNSSENRKTTKFIRSKLKKIIFILLFSFLYSIILYYEFTLDCLLCVFVWKIVVNQNQWYYCMLR